MEGYVTLADESGAPAVNHAGVDVVLLSSGRRTVTDSCGYWHLSQIPMGTYDIGFSKPGHAIQRRVSVVHVGGAGTLIGRVRLPELPHFDIAAINVVSVDRYHVDFSIRLDSVYYASIARGTAVFFFAGDSSVSSDPRTYIEAAFAGYSPASLPLDATEPANEVLFRSSVYLGVDSAVRQGDTVYAVAYSSSRDVVSYFDRSTGRSVYTSLGSRPSNVVMFVSP